MIVRELLTVLGFETDEKAVKSYDQAMRGVTKTLGAVTLASKAATAAIFGLVKASANAGDEAAKLGRQAGITAEQVQALRFAEAQTGAEGFTASLPVLNARLAEAARGAGRARTALEEYGISATTADGRARSIADILPEIADRMASMDEGQQSDLARQLGLGPRSALLLSQGADGIRQLTERFEALGGAVSNADAEASEKFNDTMGEMMVVVNSIRHAIAFELMPVLQDLVESFRDWFMANREIIRQRLSDTIQSTVRFLRMFWLLVRSFLVTVDSLAQSMGGWERVLRFVAILLALVGGVKILAGLKALAVAIRAVTLAIMANPIVAIITAIIVALALLIDELWNWVQGNDSVIGRVLGPWEDFRDFIVTLFKIIQYAINAFVEWLPKAIERAVEMAIDKLKQFGRVARSIFDKTPLGMAIGLGRNIAARFSSDDNAMADQARASAPMVNQNVNANISLDIPAGTPEQQQEALQEQADIVFRRMFQSALDSTITNFPVAE